MDARSAAVDIAWGPGGLCPTSPIAGWHGNPLRVPIKTSPEEHSWPTASAERPPELVAAVNYGPPYSPAPAAEGGAGGASGELAGAATAIGSSILRVSRL